MLPVGGEVPLAARQYFTAAVELIKQQLGGALHVPSQFQQQQQQQLCCCSEAGARPRARLQPLVSLPATPPPPLRADDFTARLAVYGVSSVLPSGIPGDPAKDYSSSGRRGDGRCGAFSPPGAAAPYALCPMPGAAPLDATVAECCRHLAYCVPPGRFALAVEDRLATVVVSPRLWRFPEAQWEGVLAHELGHAADFFLFGARYRLVNRPQAVAAAPPALRAALQAADAEPDPELRADVLGELLVLTPQRQQLCYDSEVLVQAVVEGGAACGGAGGGYMKHFTHAPLQGRAVAAAALRQ
jgi:hypothetical protein